MPALPSVTLPLRLARSPAQVFLADETSVSSRQTAVSAASAAHAPEAVNSPNPAGHAADASAHLNRQQEFVALQQQRVAVLQLIHNQINHIAGRHQQLLDEMQSLAVELAVAIARKLVHGHLQTDTASVAAMVQQMVGSQPSDGPLVVYLNPADLQALQQGGWPESAASDAAAKQSRMDVRSDAQLPRGDCRLDSRQGSLVACLELRLDEIRRSLLEVVNDSHG